MSQSVWKKEIRFRKQREPLPMFPSHLLQGQRARPEREPIAIPEPAPHAPLLPAPAASYGWPASSPVSDTAVVASDVEDTLVAWPELKAEPPAPELEPAAVAPEPPVEKLPLLKREISFRRIRKAEKRPEVEAPEVELAAVTTVPVPPVEKVPLLKREISFRRTPKARKSPKAEKTRKAKQQPKAEKQPKAEATPLLKRELHLPRPKRHRKAAPAHKVTRIVGLRIGSSQLAAAHVRNNGSAEVLQLARTPLDRGLVVAGEVRDAAALAKALKAFFATNKLPKKDIRLGVASNRIGVRVLDVPALADAKQFENAIRFRAQETLPIPVADAVLDHVVLGEEANDEGEVVRRVLVVFAHRELVSRYVDVCRQAGLRLAGIDLDAFALLRSIGMRTDGESRRACVAVAVGHERTVFAVSDGEVCDFTRVLEWGSGSIDVAIARALNLTPSQAEPIKCALDLDAAEAPASLSPMEFEAARAATKGEIGQLVRELLSSLRFYQSRPGSLDIGEVVLSGGGSQLPGFAAEVQRSLGAPVKLADPFAHVTFGKKAFSPEEPGSLVIAVGLGIEV